MIDLAIIISNQVPNLELHTVIEKVRNHNTWKTFIISCDDTAKVLGGCVIKEHDYLDSTIAELFVMAIRPECQVFGLKRRLINHLQTLYSQIAAYINSNTRKFFAKMGF